MFLRATVRKKDGKDHTYYSVVENKRLADGRVVQRHVLYLGEINSSQQLAWRLYAQRYSRHYVPGSTTVQQRVERRGVPGKFSVGRWRGVVAYAI
jgi:hypothetical protein